MTFGTLTRASIMISFALILGLGCEKKEEEVELPSSDPFTAADIEKAWDSSCIAGTDPIGAGTYHKIELNLNTGGNFTASDTWYSAAGCMGADYVAVYGTSGTYTVGAVTGTAQTLDFDVTASEIMPMNVQAQTDMNSDCGGSSPFNAGGAQVGNNGGHFSTYTITCMSADFPNSGNDTVNNIATYDGTTLTIGAAAFGIPGVFAGDTTPVSVSISLQ